MSRWRERADALAGIFTMSLLLTACSGPGLPGPDAGMSASQKLWWTTFPHWVSMVSDAGVPTSCSYLWGLEDFYAFPMSGSEWTESRAQLGALLIPSGILVDPAHQLEVPAFLAAWKALHDGEGKRVGFEMGFAADFADKRYVFDPAAESAPGIPWYQPIEILKDAGLADDMIVFIDGFDPAGALGIDLRTLAGDAYAGPITDQVKAIRGHAPQAFVAVHLGVPYLEDGTQPLGDLDIGWISAFQLAASARGTTIDAVLFDDLRSNPQQDAGVPTTIDVAGLGNALDAARAAGFKTGVFIMSYQDPNTTPPGCGFPFSGEDYEASALAGVAALQDAGLDAKVDFYDLSSWTYWPRKALPQNQAGTGCHALCAVEKALSLGCAAP
jgi:hypothetical protein